MRVIVCGSRTFTDYGTVDQVLRGMFVEYFSWGPEVVGDLTIISGGAKGADGCAVYWAEHNHTPFEVFHADWARYGNPAGAIRNKEMLDSKADLVVAFIDKPLFESKGTLNMVRIARSAGVRTIVVEVTSPHGQRPDPTLFGEGHEEAEVL